MTVAWEDGLPALAHAQDLLQTTLLHPWSDQLNQQRAAAEASLTDCTWHHVFPAMAMGSSAADTVHKLTALLSAFHLDLGPKVSECMLRNTVSWTTDYGTEHLFACLPAIPQEILVRG